MWKKYNYIEKKVELPNGVKSNLQMIDHPGAVLIAPFVNSNQIIFLRQYRPTIEKYIYELPAGTMEKGEKPLNCAKRELIEETGFKAKRISKIGEIYPVPGYSNEIIFIYKAEQLTPYTAPKDEDEIIECKLFTKGEVRGLFKSNKIKDAKSICALVMCGFLK